MVEVEDLDLQGQGYATVTFSSSSQPAGTTITLAPTARPGLFRGAVALSPTNSGAAGVLTVSSNDTIVATYLDASSGQTLNAVAVIDTTPPIISSVSAEAGYLEALISWDTAPKPADSLVQYSESPATLTNNPALTNDFNLPNQFTAYDEALDTIHEILLTGLEPNRTYFFRVVSRDKAGNTTVDDNQGHLYSFATLLPVSPPWSDDMEDPSPDWSTFMIADSETDWTWGTPGGEETAHTGNKCWGSNLGGGPISQSECYLITPGILLTGGNHATLRFWHNYDFSPKGEWGEFDIEIGAVEILTDVQGQPVPIQQYFDLSGGWEQVSVDLTPYMGQVVYVLWYYGLFSFDNVPRLGWLVDDVSITVDNVVPGTIQVTNNLSQAVFALSGPLGRTGYGQWTVISNAPPGQYVVRFGEVPYYLTPPPQTNTLVSLSNVLFSGIYTFADSNNNGVPDAWELEYFQTLGTNGWQNLDSDQDGASNYAEFIAGTDPTDPTSSLRLDSPQHQAGGLWLLEWQAMPGHSYRILGSPDASQWLPLTDWFREAGGPASLSLTPPGGAQYFFRLEVKP